ncbi:outer membrane beta-barrel family protein [Myroides sp. WP-1]|uniref:outer membrane beta-barrel family protein n=1 Tax=Myroides sp. WP-1 TaxID=2759944 RepID=UPI001C718D82|nr:outer membrane beta-barrel family protein [Myroides sp. WP-1]
MKSTLIAFCVLLFCCLDSVLYAQQHMLTGKVIDQNKDPLAFALVYLARTDNDELVSSVYTDSLGDFKISAENGNYLLVIKNYEQAFLSEKIVLTENIDLGVVEVDNAMLLDEITIATQKKRIERKADRLIFNVENSINSTGGDVLDALRVTPGVRVQNNNIAMIGKSNAAIMIDDRLVELSGDDLINFLKGIATDNIKNIEVITIPPSNYSAEGDSGVININLKKTTKNSWSNTARSNYKQAIYPSFSIGNNFNYQKERFSVLLDVSILHKEDVYTNDINYYYPTAHWKSEVYNKTKGYSFGAILNLGYNITDKTRFSFQYLGNSTKPKVKQYGKIDIYSIQNKEIEKIKESFGYIEKENSNHGFTLSFLSKLDTIGTKITVDLDYLNYSSDKKNEQFNQTRIYHNIIEPYTLWTNKNNQDTGNLSSKLDLDFPISWGTFSVGGKMSFTKTTNHIAISDSSIEDFDQTDKFTYEENIQAIYVSANRTLGDKWELKAGLRAEATQNKGYSSSINQTNKNNYVKLFPTFYISYALNEVHSFFFQYGRRVERPLYSNLNPARWYLNANSYEEGNPFLQPSLRDNIELSYMYGNLFYTNISFSRATEGVGQLTIHNEENDFQKFIRLNYYSSDDITFYEYTNFNILNWWNSAIDLTVFYSQTKTNTAYLEEKYSGWGAYFSTTQNFSLNKEKTLFAEVVYEQDFPKKFIESKTSASSNLAVGITVFLQDKKLQATLKANNILGSDRAKISNVTQHIAQSFRQYYDTQYVVFSLSYKIGNSNIGLKQTTTSNEEEKHRLN